MSEEHKQQNTNSEQTPAQQEHGNSVPVRGDTEDRRPTRKEQDVLLNVSELEVEKIRSPWRSRG
jgi:hypothetical protein